MTEFDKHIKNNVSEEEIKVPSYVSKAIEDTLEGLPEKESALQKHSYQKNWMKQEYAHIPAKHLLY